MAQQYEINAAYYQGLREMNGVDADVAEDLGIPTNPESMDRHIRAGHEATRAIHNAQPIAEVGGMAPAIPLGTSGRDASRLHANADNTYGFATPDQRDATSAATQDAKDRIRPFGDRP